MDNIDKKLRRLAKDSYYQNIYNAFKSGSHIQIFENVSNFSGIQVRFLYWLSVYSMLFEEILKHEDKLLNEEVIDDDDRMDAYLVYRNKKHDFLWKKYRRDEETAKHKSKHPKKHKTGKVNPIKVDLRREG